MRVFCALGCTLEDRQGNLRPAYHAKVVRKGKAFCPRQKRKFLLPATRKAAMLRNAVINAINPA